MTIVDNVKEILAYGDKHQGGKVAAVRHAAGAIYRAEVGQLYGDCTKEQVQLAKDVLNKFKLETFK